MAEQRRLSAILSADMVGYSRLMETDESGTIARQKALRAEIIDPKIAEHSGRIVKSTGDGLLLEFPSVVDALNCALEIQNLLSEKDTNVAEHNRIQYRIGINIGDIVVDGDDIFGEGVNVAARIEGLCQPGEVYLSKTAHDHVVGKVSLSFEDLGKHNLKNISKPVQIFRAKRKDSRNSTMNSSGHYYVHNMGDKPSIAVLPFDNLSNDADQEYFSDGISEDIITALARIRQIFVIARNSTFIYKDKRVDVQRIASDLGVQYVLEGSVRKAANRVRITAQLIDGPTGKHLWAEKYDRNLEDIFEVQDEITLTVVGAIEPELAEAEREKAKSKPPQNLAAWDFHQRGMSLIMDAVTPSKQGKMSNTKEAKLMFEEAIQQDPNLSVAYSGLALSHMYSILFGNSNNPIQDKEDGITIARRAVELDSEDAFARIALGTMYWVKREHDLALPQFKIAIELNPSSGWAYSCCGKSLAWMGHPNEAMTYLKSALELSPRDPQSGATMVGIAEAKIYLREYEKAVDWAEKSLRLPATGMWGNTALISALGHLGLMSEAQRAIDELYRRKPDFDIMFVKRNLPITDSPFMAEYIEGLRKAGLTEG